MKAAVAETSRLAKWIAVLALGLIAFYSGAAQLRVLIDSDNNVATGCTVAVPGGSFAGVEWVLDTTVDPTTVPPSITGVTRQDCVIPASNTLGPPVAVSPGGWNVGLGQGVNGYDVVETFFPTPSLFGIWRLAFVYEDPQRGADVLVSTTDEFGGPPITFLFGAPPGPIPTLGSLGLLLLVATLSGFGLFILRRHKAPLMTIVAAVAVCVTTSTWAVIVLDGLINDWSGVPPLASDLIGDAPPGSDVSAAFASADPGAGRVYFRADVRLGGVTQTISFTSVAPAGATVGGPTYNVTATATSGLPVTLAIDASAAAVCTIAGSTVSFIGTGTCVIDANQAGSAIFAPAPQVQQSFAVTKGSQTISFTSTAPAGATVGGPTYNATASATSGSPVTLTIDASAAAVCTIAGSTVSFIGAGTCVINANQAGDANYEAAPQVQQSFPVGKALQTISFTSTAPSGAVVGGPTYNVTATATSGLAVSFAIDASATAVCSIAGATVSFIGAGTCVINANQPGDAQYAPAPQVQQSFIVKGTQTITFTSAAPPAAVYQGPTYNVTATATSGLAVSFTIDASATTVCSIAGSTVSFIGTGTCTVNANQAGNASFVAAPQVQQSFTVGPNLGADAYSVVGNTQLVAAGHSTPTTPFTASPTTILANDTADVAITLTTVTDAATTGGGLVTVDSAGKFSYKPPVGQAAGTDTYVYTGTANGVSRTATITFSIANVVWYVDNAFVGTHDGRSDAPFLGMGAGAGNLGSALSNTGPATGAYIYVAKGTGATSGAYVFKANQTLIGAGATLTVGALSIPGADANTPTLGGTLTLANSVTINGIDVSTGASNGIVGTAVTGLNVTARDVTTTTGTAVSIGGAASGGTFTFRSVSASGGANGIVLQNTTGSFTVTGDGTNTTRGGNASGGTIANMAGGDGASAGTGVYLSNAQNVTLRRMTINGTNQNFGIYGTGVTNFVMQYATVAGTNGTSTAAREGSVIFDNALGASNSISDSVISGAVEDNLRVENGSGVLAGFTISNNNIQNNSSASGNIGVRFAAKTTASMTGTISGNTFTGNRTDTINTDAGDTSTLNITISGNTIVRGAPNDGNLGINVTAGVSGQVTFDVDNNKVGTPDGTTDQSLLNTGINIFAGGTSTMNGKVRNNRVINRGAGVSGSGIRVVQATDSVLNVSVSNNTVSNVGLDYGIQFDGGQNTGATGDTQIGVVNNSVSVLATALDAIRVRARNASSACSRITGNVATHPGASTCTLGGAELPCALSVSQGNTAVHNLEGGALGLAGGNPGTASNRITTFGTLTTVGSNFCTLILN
jgi:hypothetical protein